MCSPIRATAATLLVALAATSWWFVIHAQQVGTVYRIGTPWWTLIPIAIVAVVAGVLGLTGGRWPPAPGSPPSEAARRRGWRLGWAGAAVWAVLLSVIFARTPTGLGTSFLAPAQVASTVARWFPAIGSVLAVGLVGAVYEVGRRLFRSRVPSGEPSVDSGAAASDDLGSRQSALAPSDPHAIDDLLIATICGFPLVLLVVSVGEGPRHYIAQLAVLVAIGACGWIRIAERSCRGDRAGILLAIVALTAGLGLALATLIPLVSVRLVLRLAAVGAIILAVVIVGIRAGAFRRIGSTRDVIAATALSTILGSAVVLTSVVVPLRQSSIDRTRADAVKTIAAWVRADVPAGSPVVLASGLGFELALHLQASYRTSQLTDEPGVHVQAEAPLGVASIDEPASDDWVALRASPTDITSLYGYRSSAIIDRLRKIGPTTWIQTELTGVNQVNPIVDALTEARGVTVAASWDWPYGNGRLESIVFRIDPDRLELPGRLFVTTQALERIVAGLEAGGPASGPAAASLLARVQVAGADPAGVGLLDRLRRLTLP